MAINLHLQNLSRTATNLDIRRFFYGLDIPEGGVQIVGGPDGDAFITFGTEDGLLRALMFDHQPLLGQPVKLFLANRDDMERVIETRRRDLEAAKQARLDSLPQQKVPTSHDMGRSARRSSSSAYNEHDHYDMDERRDHMSAASIALAQQKMHYSDNMGRSAHRLSSSTYNERDHYDINNKREHISVDGITLDPNNPFDLAVKKLLESKARASGHTGDSSQDNRHSRKRSHSSSHSNSHSHSSEKNKKTHKDEPDFDISLPYHALVAQQASRKQASAATVSKPDDGPPPWMMKPSQPDSRSMANYRGSADDLDFRSTSKSHTGDSRSRSSSSRHRDKDDPKRQDRRDSKDRSDGLTNREKLYKERYPSKDTDGRGGSRDRHDSSRDGEKESKRNGEKESKHSHSRDRGSSKGHDRDSGRTRDRHDSTRSRHRSRSRDRQEGSRDRERKNSKVSSRSRSRSRDRLDRRDRQRKEGNTYDRHALREDKDTVHGRLPQFVRMTNIATTVTARDIRDFLCYYIIPEGGITLKMGEDDSLIAFIKGFNETDNAGMEFMSGRDLHGRLVEITSITERQYDLKMSPEEEAQRPPSVEETTGYAPPPYAYPPPPPVHAMPPYPMYNPWMPPGPFGVRMPMRMPPPHPMYAGNYRPPHPPGPMMQPITNMPPTSNFSYLRLISLPVNITACTVWSWFNGPAGYCRGVTYVTNSKDRAFAFAAFSTKEQRDYELQLKPEARVSQADSMYKQLASLDSKYSIYESTPAGKDNLVLMKRTARSPLRDSRTEKTSGSKAKKAPQKDDKGGSSSVKSAKPKRHIETHTSSERAKKARNKADVKGNIYITLDSGDKKPDVSKTKSEKSGDKSSKGAKKVTNPEKTTAKDNVKSSKDNVKSAKGSVKSTGDKGKSLKDKARPKHSEKGKASSSKDKGKEKQNLDAGKANAKDEKKEKVDPKKSVPSGNEAKEATEKQEINQPKTKAAVDEPGPNKDDKVKTDSTDTVKDNKQNTNGDNLDQAKDSESNSAKGEATTTDGLKSVQIEGKPEEKENTEAPHQAVKGEEGPNESAEGQKVTADSVSSVPKESQPLASGDGVLVDKTAAGEPSTLSSEPLQTEDSQTIGVTKPDQPSETASTQDKDTDSKPATPVGEGSEVVKFPESDNLERKQAQDTEQQKPDSVESVKAENNTNDDEVTPTAVQPGSGSSPMEDNGEEKSPEDSKPQSESSQSIFKVEDNNSKAMESKMEVSSDSKSKESKIDTNVTEQTKDSLEDVSSEAGAQPTTLKTDKDDNEPGKTADKQEPCADKSKQPASTSKQSENKHHKDSHKSIKVETKQNQSHHKQEKSTSKPVASESKSAKSDEKVEKDSKKSTKQDKPKAPKKDHPEQRRDSRDDKEYEQKEGYKSNQSLDDLESISSDFSESDLDSLMTISELSSDDDDDSEEKPVVLPGVLVRALNFPLDISESLAFDFFKDFSPIPDSARMSWTSKGAVIVNIRMQTTEDAEAAIKNLNQKTYNGQPITVFLAGGR